MKGWWKLCDQRKLHSISRKEHEEWHQRHPMSWTLHHGKKTFAKGVSLMGANAMPTHLQGKIIPNNGEGSSNLKVHSTNDGCAKEM